LQQFFSIFDQNIRTFQYFYKQTFSIPNGIIEGKLQWLLELLSNFLGKSRRNPENTEGLAALSKPLHSPNCSWWNDTTSRNTPPDQTQVGKIQVHEQYYCALK
jgi:hypothetical protein